MLEPAFWVFFGKILALLCGWTIVALLFGTLIGRLLSLNDLERDYEEDDEVPYAEH